MTSLLRTRWAAIGAAVAVTLGAGGLSIVDAAIGSGERAVFVPITPCRVLDTRASEAVPGRQTPLGAGETFTQSTHGNNGKCTGIPADATGLTLNVTTTNATINTFITIWPTGPDRPVASNLNPAPNQPPTPNAVVTDISPAGQFNIFNLAGSVDILIDITGYFADHHHDDRYYTKSQLDVAKAQDKWISIDPLGMSLRAGASVAIGFGPNTGVVLPGGPTDLPQFEFGFTVPPDHTANTPMTVEILWHIGETGCTVNLSGSYSGISRVGQTPRGNAGFSVASAAVPATANTTVRSTATVSSAGFGLAPGDAVIVGFFRSFNSDTCSEAVRVTGLRVIYS
ncbi:MAG TPA: hypothetical protein VK853_00870 [Ilumatobacteraceae bacterium]|nr:hypothetical protein [Ilumatobacteraceae bacterium]